MRFDAALGQAAATVFRCTTGVCESAPLGGDRQSPRIRLTSAYGRGGLVHAFTQWGIYESRDEGRSFRKLDLAWGGDLPLTDLSVNGGGKVLLATVISVGPSRGATGGLYRSLDGGKTWQRITHQLLDRGGHVVGSAGKRILVGLRDGGIACSRDGGESWARRCR